MTALAIVVHWLHVVAGAIWFGAQAFLFAALWPALLRRPAPEARAMLGAIVPGMSRLMGIVGPVVIVTGLLRGTWLGPLRSAAALGTAYGATFLAAMALVAALSVIGGRARTSLGPRLFAGDAWHPGAAAYLRRFGAVTLGTLAAVLACMVLMRFGL